MTSERVARIEALLEAADPAAIELVGELLGLYGEGLARVMDLAGESLGAELAADELVSHLLLLHDLHPLDLRARVEAALPGAEILAVEDGLVRVRVRASGCGSSAVSAAEQAVRAAAPEADRVEVEVGPGERPMIPVESLTVRRAAEVR
ncbi:hypothetical protein FAF44_14820 [Nonomuraea sp. MG754425]|nr:hypothetical protein [Nonomuraea sp. MG754425]